MKRMEPNLRQPIESGDLLYDLVLAQQADEEELKNTLYQNQTLEDFSGGRMEFQNCVFRGCQFVRCRLDNFSFTDVLLENCNLSGSTLRDLATQRVILRGCKLMGCNLSQSLLQNTAFLNCNLRYAVLAGSKLKSVLLDGCTLEEASKGWSFPTATSSASSCCTPRWRASTCAAARLRACALLSRTCGALSSPPNRPSTWSPFWG